MNGIQVVGSIVGTRLDLAETFELHAQGRTTVEYEKRQLDDVNECFAAVEEGRVKARLVFDMNQPTAEAGLGRDWRLTPTPEPVTTVSTRPGQ